MRRTIEAIPTSYSGVQFRSATEARFAKWCDTRGLKWFYEPEGFEFGGTRYLPDFYIPSGRWVIEIKPPIFMDECWKIQKMRIALPEYHYVIGTMDRDVFKWAAHSDWNGYGIHQTDPNEWQKNEPFYDEPNRDNMWFCRRCTRPFFPTSGGYSCPHCNYYDGDSGFEANCTIPFNGSLLSSFK